ncbi:MAG: hypothetical protein HFH41_04755 [Lachnospiraceae bacterium]|nr:hypothetical protein [Lachnospiraceae bacterium]
MAQKGSVKPEVRWKNFWRQNDHFADLFNAVLFQGKEVLKPEALEEIDTDMSGILQFKEYEESLVRARDVVKKSAFGVEFVVFGLESQQRIHYAMPLRTLLYDGLGYLKEYQELAHFHKEAKDFMTKDEFLSGIRKEDRLHPIVSVTVYYGEQSWDGPLSLKDMITEMPKEIEEIFSDYKLNLIQVRESQQYKFHNEDVQTVFEISREIFKGNFHKIYQLYQNREIDAELIAMIGMITDSSELIGQGENKEVRNMCTALEKLKNEGRQEGRLEGIQESVRKLLQKGISVREVADLLELTEAEVLKIQQKC